VCICVLYYCHQVATQLVVCICVLYYCHQVATQLQLNIYHIMTVAYRVIV